MNKDFPKCNMHIDCFANKEGYCIALKLENFSDVACPFYKTTQEVTAARLKSLGHLAKIGRDDLIEKHGGLKAYGN